MFLPLMAQLKVGRDVGRPRTRPDAVRGDKAYSSRAIRAHLRDRGIKAVIPEPDDQKGHRKRRGSRGGRPVGLDAADYRNRNVIERQYGRIKQWRGIATRYDKHAIVYRAAVVLNAVIAWAKTLSDTPKSDPDIPHRLFRTVPPTVFVSVIVAPLVATLVLDAVASMVRRRTGRFVDGSSARAEQRETQIISEHS